MNLIYLKDSNNKYNNKEEINKEKKNSNIVHQSHSHSDLCLSIKKETQEKKLITFLEEGK